MEEIISAKIANRIANLGYSLNEEIKFVNICIRAEAEKGKYYTSIDLRLFHKDKRVPLIKLMKNSGFDVVCNQNNEIAHVRWGKKI